MSIAVSLKGVSLHFGNVVAVNNLSFEIEQGEFFSMLGPSGSGKTSCLRLIAGFERPDSGEVFLDGQSAASLPPFLRNVNTVFQDYALFPHMTVRENVAYSLMIKKVPIAQRVKQADEMLELVQLPGVDMRKPSELSGGQRQRVSLARALINHPKVLLLDEPLGALDLKLREQMQEELKTLQRRLGITFIYVTHDQKEALTMSDRVAIFNHGTIQQIGSPKEIYEHPQNRFVAGFVGSSNLLEANQANTLFQIDHSVAIRPECLKLCAPADPLQGFDYSLQATVKNIIYRGSTHKIVLDIDGITLIAVLDNSSLANISVAEPGARICAQLKRDDINPIDS